MKKISLFDHLNNLTIHKKDFDHKNDECKKSYSNYMINRFVSMTDIYLPYVNEINKYELPNDVHYQFYKAFLPKRQQYFKYIKPKKEIDENTKELLCEYFECGNNEIKNHLEILTEEQINKIKDLYKHR